MDTDYSSRPADGDGPSLTSADGEPVLLQLRSDRRLGHEWDDWNGEPLPNGGVFEARETLFFRVLALTILLFAAVLFATVWLVGPRLADFWTPLPGVLQSTVLVAVVAAFGWIACIAFVLRSGRNWMPPVLAERGLLPWVMPKVESAARFIGESRDRVGNAALQVYNGLSVARNTSGLRPRDLLILLPRCLGKESMQAALRVSAKYGVPAFVAARGRYAREMIHRQKPKGIVAVACERDLVSGIHDVARQLPVLGTTLQLGEGPCRNTAFAAPDLENQVRRMLGLSSSEEATVERPG